MKKPVIITLIIALFAGFGILIGQNITAENKTAENKTAESKTTIEKKYALLVSAEDHVKMASKTANSLFTDVKYNASAFEVIICGKAAETLKGDAEWNKIFEEGKALGIVYKACGISLEKFKIDVTSIPKEVEVVPNGILRMYDLMEEGYITVEL